MKRLSILLLLITTSAHAIWTEDKYGNTIVVARTQKEIARAEAGQLKHLNQIYKPFIIEVPDNTAKKSKSVDSMYTFKVKGNELNTFRVISEADIDNNGKKLKGQTKRDVECFAQSIFREAGGLKESDQLAVGQVHINRLRTGAWGDSLCEVVHYPAQFSWTGLKNLKPISKETHDKYVAMAKSMINGVRVKSLDNLEILHYHTSNIHKEWDKQGKLVAQAGPHVFFARVPY